MTPKPDTRFRLFTALPPRLYEALCDRAEEEDTTLAEVTRNALREHLKEELRYLGPEDAA